MIGPDSKVGDYFRDLRNGPLMTGHVYILEGFDSKGSPMMYNLTTKRPVTCDCKKEDFQKTTLLIRAPRKADKEVSSVQEKADYMLALDEFVGPSKHPTIVGTLTDTACTSNCWDAKGEECHCSCGGKNHGIGYEAMLKNS